MDGWMCRIMDEMREVLQEGSVEQRVQYLIEGLFKIQRDGFEKSGHPQIPEGLDLLEDDDKLEVKFEIEDTPNVQQTLNIFKFDPDYEQHEKEYEVCTFKTLPMTTYPLKIPLQILLNFRTRGCLQKPILLHVMMNYCHASELRFISGVACKCVANGIITV